MLNLKLTPEELQALAGLIDAGVKAIGLRAVKDTAGLLAKIEAAALETPDSEEQNDG